MRIPDGGMDCGVGTAPALGSLAALASDASVSVIAALPSSTSNSSSHHRRVGARLNSPSSGSHGRHCPQPRLYEQWSGRCPHRVGDEQVDRRSRCSALFPDRTASLPVLAVGSCGERQPRRGCRSGDIAAVASPGRSGSLLASHLCSVRRSARRSNGRDRSCCVAGSC
jgi:hypothetical protein